MIPASYMFKGIYHQHWEEAVPTPAPRPVSRFTGGMLTPALNALHSLLHRQPKAGRQYFGTHVYR